MFLVPGNSPDLFEARSSTTSSTPPLPKISLSITFLAVAGVKIDLLSLNFYKSIVVSSCEPLGDTKG